MENIRRNNGWINKKRPPAMEDGDKQGYVLVWHVYQGVMLTKVNRFAENSFFVYWMPTAAWLEQSPWIRATDRKPAEADADNEGCVLAWHDLDGLRVTGWHQFRGAGLYTRWTPLPAPPEDHRELRKLH